MFQLYLFDTHLPEGQYDEIVARTEPPIGDKISTERIKRPEVNYDYESGSYTFSTINGLRMTTAHGGETLEDIARHTGADVEELLKINEEYGYRTRTMSPGEIVFFKRKKRSYKGDKEFHLLSEGETMWDVAQMYGIKLDNLYAKNKMPKGSEPLPGQNIYISKTAPKGKRPAYTKHPRRNADTEFLFAIE